MPMPPIVWFALGGLTTYVVSNEAAKKKISSATKNMLMLPPGLDRMPKPNYAVETPETEADWLAIDMLICEAHKKGIIPNGIPAYVLSELYPDFPWPSSYGDHRSAILLDGFVTYRTIEAMRTGEGLSETEALDEFCKSVPEPEPEPGPEPETP